MSRVRGKVRSTRNSPAVRLSTEETKATIMRVLEQNRPAMNGSNTIEDYEKHLANVFTRLGFRKLSMVEIMDLTEPERMNAARATLQERGREARERLRKEAVVAELDSLAEDLQSWTDGPLICMDKCGDPKCRDDIRIGALEEIVEWVNTRKEGIQKEVDVLKAEKE